MSQIRGSQLDVPQANVSEDSHFQISPFNIGVTNASSHEVGHLQVGSVEVNTGQLSFSENDSTQINPIQLPSTAFALQPIDFNATEISLPSGVALQQLLTGYQRTLHSPTLQTGTTPWTNFLQGSTQFNLNLEITNLPTGQLAEATLTHFDANGLPSGGTLTLDDNANGLGWFIDNTPWENSEFNLPQTETLLRATPGSAAYGRYGLLTTVLHELGHLAGIIHGNPAYPDRIQYINGSPTFIGNGYEAQLTNDLSHLADPTQLMSPYLAPGIP